jgi:diguanylate cyclase (GGDEF)-like protein
MGVSVVSQPLQMKPAEGIDVLSASEQAERLRFAMLASGVAAFDWTIADDHIVWDGTLDLIPYHNDTERLSRGAHFQGWLAPDSRIRLMQLIETRNAQQSTFELALEASSAMGSLWLSMVGTRLSRADGRTERLTGVLRITTEHQREMQRLSYLATRDELTGHLNRNALRGELSQAIDRARAEDRHCAFLVASIDRLAVINDGYGFDAGDEVIVAVGERLARTLRASDITGRIAGNKFGVILRNCAEREISVVAERLRAVVRGSIVDTRCGQVPATISLGAVWLPTTAATSQEAMLRAEEALDRARVSGRDGFSMYEKSPQREGARLRLMGIADEVTAALNTGRLHLAYQPIIDAATRKPVHYEGLLRMERVDGTMVTAGHFVPAAEQLGLIRMVDRRSLEMTIAALYANPGISLAVNVSGTAASDPSWLKSFIECVKANKPVASRLIVELTETAALDHFEENAQFVSQLREMGARIAIDDFGAGYTSFRNLQMLHVDMVKIDGTFITGLSQSPENQLFVRTLVDLAKKFDLKTVAEWVENEADAALLSSFGIDYLQGFFFGEPELRPRWNKKAVA